MSAIAGILLDKDGTLVDFNRTWLPPYRRAAEYLHSRFGAAADPGRLLARGGFIAESETWRVDSPLASGCNQDIIDLWSRVIGAPLEGGERRALEAIFRLPPGDYVAAVDDLAGLLAGLRGCGPSGPSSIRLGVATMDDEANAHSMLRAAGVDRLFDFVCGADSGHGVKPQPGMVRAFCRACRLPAARVMVVGDSPKDLNMGRNAGAGWVVGVLTGAHRAADLAPGADRVLASIAELPGLLRETQC